MIRGSDGESNMMDSVLDKEQRLSEGHSEAEDRKGVEERDPPGEEI